MPASTAVGIAIVRAVSGPAPIVIAKAVPKTEPTITLGGTAAPTCQTPMNASSSWKPTITPVGISPKKYRQSLRGQSAARPSQYRVNNPIDLSQRQDQPEKLEAAYFSLFLQIKTCYDAFFLASNLPYLELDSISHGFLNFINIGLGKAHSRAKLLYAIPQRSSAA